MQTILFVLESFFPSHRAGTEVYVLNLCRYFKKNGWHVTVLITSSNAKKTYTYEGISIQTFEIPARPDPRELNGLLPPRGIENFATQLKKIQPDWVHFHSFGRAINSYHLEKAKNLGFKTAFTPHLGSMFCIKGNLRLFGQMNCDTKVDENRCTACFIHSKGKHKSISILMSAGIVAFTKQNALKKVLPPAWFQANHRQQELERIKQNADAVFAIAPWIQHAFETNGNYNSVLIPQGISPLFFKHEKTEHKPIRKPLQFVFVGRMQSSKGFHLLKEAWQHLEKQKDIHLHIITNPSGDELDYFSTHKTWATQKTNVTWNEALTQQGVANYFHAMDVLILPSISNEVAPLVILEAASRKVPVITSDYIAMKDSIKEDENGWLFENGNVEALKEVITSIVNQPERILKVASRIEKPHSMDEVAKIVEQQLLKF